MDLVLIAGDLTDGGYPAEIGAFRRQTGGAAGFKAPVWFVPGNHDIGNKSGCQKNPGPSTQTVASVQQAFGSPTFFARSFRNPPAVRVIGINSPILGSGLPLEEEMWKFLASELQAPRPNVPTLLLTHYPLFVSNENEPNSFWNVNQDPRKKLMALLRRAKATMVLSGHLHCALFLDQHDGITVVTTPPISHFYNTSLLGWTLITVDGQIVKHEFRTLDGAPVADAIAQGVCDQPDDCAVCEGEPPCRCTDTCPKNPGHP